MRNIARILGVLVLVLLAAVLLTPVAPFKSTIALAHMVVCDFTTGGGWIKIASGTAESNGSLVGSDQKANFGLVGGCKNDGFYGHVNYVDHNIGLHVSSDSILGYFDPCPGCKTGPGTASKARDICGVADTNLYGKVFFRARTIDAEQQDTPPPKDKYGIKLCPYPGKCSQMTYGTYLAPTRCLADDMWAGSFPGGDGSACHLANPGGGDIELHKANPSNTGPATPPTEFQACGGDDYGLGY